VVEFNHELEGGLPFGFLVKRKNSTSSDRDLVEQAIAHVRESIGSLANFKQAVVVESLPKLSSGKIARNTLKDMINNKPFKVKTAIKY
jgi:propionyl-CoA synthetase